MGGTSNAVDNRLSRLARRAGTRGLAVWPLLGVTATVAALLAGELGCDAAWQADQVLKFNQVADGYLVKNSLKE